MLLLWRLRWLRLLLRHHRRRRWCGCRLLRSASCCIGPILVKRVGVLRSDRCRRCRRGRMLRFRRWSSRRVGVRSSSGRFLCWALRKCSIKKKKNQRVPKKRGERKTMKDRGETYLPSIFRVFLLGCGLMSLLGSRGRGRLRRCRCTAGIGACRWGCLRRRHCTPFLWSSCLRLTGGRWYHGLALRTALLRPTATGNTVGRTGRNRLAHLRSAEGRIRARGSHTVGVEELARHIGAS